ncbi:hypothetical protein HPP92_021246 [Vanilla planifolia]|uniref:Potassium transporter n=1 Tax=Vanilla planifolia TaxID=51239 RepID=A0A835PYI9_VANPL|nr:hypothetical protein HPP92_021246 [Vanilla planifolia]
MADTANEVGNKVDKTGEELEEPVPDIKGRKISWGKLRRVDSLSLEAGRIPGFNRGGKVSWQSTLQLAFQSIGVVYGDIGTSPLYVYSSTFTDGIKERDDILGVLSLILYTILVIPLIKYVLIVLWANDDGDGGTFALYSLISRHARISLIPNQQAEDTMLSNYKLEIPSKKWKRAQWIKQKLESNKTLQITLLLITILATSMIIGDGVLTPSISVLSAVSGIKEKASSLKQGTEAMFADLSHFNVRAIQISFTAILFPAVSLAYIGQASYLTRFPEEVGDTFYKSIPGPLFWPTFLIAIAASIIASQAMISGAFSIIQQSQGLSCFPRVRVIHTSVKYEGQVYIPEVNYTLMVACVIVTGIFRSTTNIGNAYGIAVVTVMIITTALVTLVMLFIWKTSIWWISLFVIVIGGIEAIYLSSVLSKFVKGGYLPLLFSLFLMLIMSIWHYVHVKRYKFELEHKVSSNYIQDLALNRNITRIPGIGLLYSELVQGIPPIFPHFIEKIPSIHSVLVFVSVKHLPIGKVEPHERFLFRQIEPRGLRLFRCVVRYGYKDVIEAAEEFEKFLIKHLKEFIHHEFFLLEGEPEMQNHPTVEPAILGSSTTEATDSRQHRTLLTTHAEETIKAQSSANNSSGSIHPATSNRSANASITKVGIITAMEEEKHFIQKEMEKGMVYLLGEIEMVAKPHSSIIKKLIINKIYNFMRRNFRHSDETMSIPKAKLLKVGMTYEI